MPETVQEIIDLLPEHFDPEAWGDSDAKIAFDVSGEGGGQWLIKIIGGMLSIDEGTIQGADMTVNVSAADLMAIVRGDLNAVGAFMTGKVKVSGDVALAMKLQALLGV
ncbi:MAG: SCP2 sterol-binding domain-containing protein [Anaerolineae bacterium]|nr:SCP2 sterol-binding domain-containing protein [Anaerolineae bacterium]